MKPNSFTNLSRSKKVKRALAAFLLTPASPRPLAWLRIGVALTLLGQAYAVSGDVFELFGASGLLQGSLSNYLIYQPYVPRLSALVEILEPLGVSERQCLVGLCLSYAVSLVALLVGFGTRVAAVTTWFTHWTLMASGHTTNYGADQFAQIFLFYFIWMPIGEEVSVDRLIKGVPATATPDARLCLRVLQIHLSLVYFVSGFEKALGPQWWNGDSIWRSMMLPIYLQYDFSWMASVPWFAKISGWGTLITEMGYPIFIWVPKTRYLWIALTLGMHAGICLFLGLWVFGVLMAIFTFTLFGISAEPKTEAVTRREVPWKLAPEKA